jgi:hypothetical protein
MVVSVWIRGEEVVCGGCCGSTTEEVVEFHGGACVGVGGMALVAETLCYTM